MLKNSYPRYFHTKDGQRLFVNTNFAWENFDSNEPLIVFNYGLVCNIEHWAHQVEYFDEHGYQILTHDYRAHFNSSGSEDISSVTFKNMAEDLKQILDAVGAKQSIHLGHSMGVNVTLEFARRYSEGMLAQVLVSGTVIPPQDIMFDSNFFDIALPYIQMVADKYPRLYGAIWKTSYMNPILRKVVHDGGFNTKRVPMDFIHLYLKRIGELPPTLFMQLLKEMKEHDVINHLHEIHIPSLIVGGDKDKIIPNYVQDILHSHLPESELYIVKDGSHVPQVDSPNSLNQRIMAFIRKVAPRRPISRPARAGN